MKIRFLFLILFVCLNTPLIVFSQDETMINNLIGDWVETQIVYKGQGYLISGLWEKGFNKIQQ